ncbi:MAG TPA: hypothetical protein EYH07_19045 [Kiloniellaceae bacterium]|nr:hypothetical protein [Kiloniellaceae bacterium]HIP80543.1 hypothetical protein [Kiloniellaceae bacterium]
MYRLAFAVTLGLSALLQSPSGGHADEKLTAAEIQTLLEDRTALGNWRGTETRQYFEASGATVYLEKGGAPDEGKWKVDTAKNQYCSRWRRGGWACYDVETDGATYYWVTPGDDYRSPFTITDGRQMGF